MNLGNNIEAHGNAALIEGVRKYAMNVRDLEIDLIDHINPFSEAYAILAKSMDEKRLTQIATIINAKKVTMSKEDAQLLTKRAIQFKKERGRSPSIISADPWEKQMPEGAAVLARILAEERRG